MRSILVLGIVLAIPVAGVAQAFEEME